MFVCCRSEDCVIELFLKGAALGFLIAAPVGPIGLLCIARTLRAGWSAGFFSLLGAATADAAYAAVAACGLTALTGALTALSAPLHLGGALLLFVLGLTTLRAKAPNERANPNAHSVGTAYASTVLLTLLNPATILSFVAIFAAAIGSPERSPDLRPGGCCSRQPSVSGGAPLGQRRWNGSTSSPASV
ncbi:MAG: LysE family translocator [Vulcanimicrobiaceae bacterium]